MKRFILTAIVLSMILVNVTAQNEGDALRYSYLKQVGTARFTALSGAFGALGADFSTLSSNPAGIALYKRSELTLSPDVYFGSSSSSYLGKTMEDGRNNFAVGNAGLILTMKPVDRLDRSEFKNFQFGFGVNRMADFNNRYIYEGVNSENSLLDAYLDYSGNKNPETLNSFDTRLAFDTYLIDTIPGQAQPTYVNAYSYLGGFSSALQRKSTESWGSVNEMVFSGGANLSDRFYFGLTFGFPFVRYYQRTTYTEYNQNTEKDLDHFSTFESLETHGSGFNLKIGTIVRATDWLRIGIAYHTPTWYNDLNDRYYTRMNSYFMTYVNGENSYYSTSPDGEFNYDIKTPYRLIASAAVIIGKIGLISADYEYLDYSNARLSPTTDFIEPNDVIKRNFKGSQNLRVGTEWNAGPVQFRGGYSYYGSPFESGVNDGQLSSYSGGIGFREKDFFVDAALSYSKATLDDYMYGTDNIKVNAAEITREVYNFLITFGYRFD